MMAQCSSLKNSLLRITDEKDKLHSQLKVSEATLARNRDMLKDEQDSAIDLQKRLSEALKELEVVRLHFAQFEEVHTVDSKRMIKQLEREK